MRKYISGTLLAMLLCVILLPMRVNAESGDGFQLNKEGVVTVFSRHAAKEKISSLQFSLLVDSAEADQVEFRFADTNARIAEFRYDESRNQLNIYMAGVAALFAENTDSLEIGRIMALDSNGNDVDAEVKIVENSLRYVYGTELKQMEEVELPGTVLIGPSSQTAVQTPPPAQETPSPSGEGEDPNTGWDPGWQESGSNSQGKNGGAVNTQTAASVSNKVASAATPSPSTTPSVSDTPSPEPESAPSEPVDEPVDEIGQQDEDMLLSASASSGNNDSEENVEKESRSVDWLMIVVVIAIVIFAAVAVISVVVLKGKKNPHAHEE